MKTALREYFLYLKAILEKQIDLKEFDRTLSLRLDWIEEFLNREGNEKH